MHFLGTIRCWAASFGPGGLPNGKPTFWPRVTVDMSKKLLAKDVIRGSGKETAKGRLKS